MTVCNIDGCQRDIESPQGMAGHRQLKHKPWWLAQKKDRSPDAMKRVTYVSEYVLDEQLADVRASLATVVEGFASAEQKRTLTQPIEGQLAALRSDVEAIGQGLTQVVSLLMKVSAVVLHLDMHQRQDHGGEHHRMQTFTDLVIPAEQRWWDEKTYEQARQDVEAAVKQVEHRKT